jgi:di/tricarboxylate transporter
VGDLSTPQLVFFAILLAAVVLLVTEKLRNDVVAMLIVMALAVTGLLTPVQALSGFGASPLSWWRRSSC